jgi:hypothetical protein
MQRERLFDIVVKDTIGLLGREHVLGVGVDVNAEQHCGRNGSQQGRHGVDRSRALRGEADDVMLHGCTPAVRNLYQACILYYKKLN